MKLVIVEHRQFETVFTSGRWVVHSVSLRDIGLSFGTLLSVSGHCYPFRDIAIRFGTLESCNSTARHFRRCLAYCASTHLLSMQVITCIR